MFTSLGHVVGLLLDRNASRMPGEAVILQQRDGEVVERLRLQWLDIDIWRVDEDDQWSLCDGKTVGFGSGNVLHEAAPMRPGWPSYWMQLVFPLRGHVWGRLGDDYYMQSVRPAGDNAFISLQGAEDAREGHLLVDEEGFILEFAGPHGSLSLVRGTVGAAPRAELFVLPGNRG